MQYYDEDGGEECDDCYYYDDDGEEGDGGYGGAPYARWIRIPSRWQMRTWALVCAAIAVALFGALLLMRRRSGGRPCHCSLMQGAPQKTDPTPTAPDPTKAPGATPTAPTNAPGNPA